MTAQLLPAAAPSVAWLPWQTWDPANARPGPVHGPRKDLPGSRKSIPWPQGTVPGELVYFATADHRPPAPGSSVVVCEGEKTADAAAAAGYLAAATVCGAPSDPSDAVVALLAQYRVILAPDADEPGQRHMQRLAGRLERAGVARLYWVDPPAWAAKGWDLADVDRTTCVELVTGARPIATFSVDELEAIDADSFREEPPPTTIGDRTAVDLSHGLPPDQLAGVFLTPEGPTILYARGGTGKGLVACWLLGQLVRAGHVVMVLDYEGHEREWGSRLRGLGMTDDELRQVHYRAPFGEDWTAPTGALSAVAAAVREDAERVAATYLVVDSYSVATSNGDTMGGEAAAREYFTALSSIGLPSLTIAHVRGDSSRFPERPFGSVFVHNLARETWAVEKLAEREPDMLENVYAPAIVALELRNQKANGRAKAAAQFLTFTFYADGSIAGQDDRPSRRPIADQAADVLAEGPMTAAAIAAAIAEDGGDTLSVDVVRNALRRQPRRFVEATTGRPRKWSVA